MTEVSVPITHMTLGNDGQRKEKSGKPTTVSGTDAISEAANEEGVVY